MLLLLWHQGIAGGDVGPDNLYTLGKNGKMDAIYTDTGQEMQNTES